MKIHILGGSGTGKTYIANKIAKQHNICHFDLDNIYWDHMSNTYGIKMSVENRTQKLNDILKNNDWIIEGVFYDWLRDSFSKADYIFILTTKPIVFHYRIIRRFIRRKFGIEKSKKETLKSLKDLLIWTNKYQKYNIPKIIEFLEPYKGKVFFVKNLQDINDIINYSK